MDSFSNVPIDFDSIPKAEEITFRPIEKKYLGVSLLATTFTYLIFAGILIGIFYMAESKKDGSIEYIKYAFILLAIFYVISLALVFFGFRWKGYIIREKDIIYRTGLIIRKRVHIPFNRVQHCEVAQGAIERIVNLSKLKIYTAGGGRSDLSIPGLLEKDALKMKQFILKKTNDTSQIKVSDESE